MPSPNRITIPMESEYIDVLKVRAEQHDLAYGKLITCFLLLSDAEIADIIARTKPIYDEKRSLKRQQTREARLAEKKQEKEAQKEAMKAIKGMSAEQINEMLARFKQQGD